MILRPPISTLFPYTTLFRSIRVNEVVILERTKSSAITGELRIKIGFAANTFAVTDSLLINAEKTEILNLSETTKDKSARVFRVRRRFHRIAAQPPSNEDHRQLSFGVAWLRDDRPKPFAVRSSNRIVNDIDVRIAFARAFCFARKFFRANCHRNK